MRKVEANKELIKNIHQGCGNYIQAIIKMFIGKQLQVTIYIYNSKSLDVVQSLYFGSKLPSSGTYK